MWLISPSAPIDRFKGSSNQLPFFFLFEGDWTMLSAISSFPDECEIDVNQIHYSTWRSGLEKSVSLSAAWACLDSISWRPKKGQDAGEACERPGAMSQPSPRWQGTTQRNPRPRALCGNEAVVLERLMTSHAARSGGAPLAARWLRGATPGGSTLTTLLPPQ